MKHADMAKLFKNNRVVIMPNPHVMSSDYSTTFQFYKGTLRQFQPKDNVALAPPMQIGDVRKKNIDFLPDITELQFSSESVRRFYDKQSMRSPSLDNKRNKKISMSVDKNNDTDVRELARKEQLRKEEKIR